MLHMLGPAVLARTLLPVGEMTKAEVRVRASALGLRTATKPDSQDVCFITASGRASFLAARIPLHPGRLVDADSGDEVGAVDAVELVTVGQHKGLGAAATSPDGSRRFVLDVDVAAATVTVGSLSGLFVDRVGVDGWTWAVTDPPASGTSVLVQCSAHGATTPGVWHGSEVGLSLTEPIRRVAAGQSVVAYGLDNDTVLGGGIARKERR